MRKLCLNRYAQKSEQPTVDDQPTLSPDHADNSSKKKVRTKRGANKASEKDASKKKGTVRTTPKKVHRKGQKGGSKQ